MKTSHRLLVVAVLVAAALSLIATVSAEEAIPVTIKADQTGPRLNPFIYGQFIEHLGRCIYGGIWSEMLEDRKFYFPITEEYSPYRSLQDKPLPVVGASPWQIIGAASDVTMVKQDSFVGDHTPRLASGAGIRQRDLAVVAGKQYAGYIWLKADGEETGPVELTMVFGDDSQQNWTLAIEKVAGEYQKQSFSFTAPVTTDTAMLEIRIHGKRAAYVGTASLMPADNVRGMRADTLALLKQLNAPIYRWPGGNFVSGYDWRDGIGPRDRRPPRKNPAWTGVEHNDFGLDEFIDFCREVQTEPMIAANTGFGDAYSAAQEVEYCNGSGDSIDGAWRIGNGHAQPYGVKYWCVGNEMFGPWQLGYMQQKHYVLKHNCFAEKMLAVDPSLKLVGVGDLGGIRPKFDPTRKVGWSEGMLTSCKDSMDYISEHFYRGQKKDVLQHVAQLRDAIRQKAQGHRELQKKLGLFPEHIIPIAMDEWNYWHRDYVYGELGCIYDVSDALGVAAGLHEYSRNTDVIQMAHYAQTVNVIGCIKTTKTDAFLSTTALPLLLYREHFGSLPVHVAGDWEPRGLDVAAALTSDKEALTIGVVNPHAQPQRLQLTIDGVKTTDQATLWRIAGKTPHDHNSVDQRPVTIDGPNAVKFDGSLNVPPYSISLYRFTVAGMAQ